MEEQVAPAKRSLVNNKVLKQKIQAKRKAVLAEVALGERGDNSEQPITMIKGKLLTKDQVSERGLLD